MNPTTLNYRIAIDTYNLTTPVPQVIIDPDPTGCPPIVFEIIADPNEINPTTHTISDFIYDLTPDPIFGWSVVTWDQSLAGETYSVLHKIYVPGYAAVN